MLPFLFLFFGGGPFGLQLLLREANMNDIQRLEQHLIHAIVQINRLTCVISSGRKNTRLLITLACQFSRFFSSGLPGGIFEAVGTERFPRDDWDVRWPWVLKIARLSKNASLGQRLETGLARSFGVLS